MIANFYTEYDNAGNITRTQDWNGNVTVFSYNSRNLEILRTDAYGTSRARTTTTEWHPVLNKPTRIVTPTLETVLVYSGDNLVTRTQFDLTGRNPDSRTWTYGYTPQGLLASVNGPLPDTGGSADITTYTYNASGRLTAVTNALNQQVQVTAHNALGYPATIVDANGVRTTLGYDARGWLTSASVEVSSSSSLITSYSRDATGNVTSITLPDNSSFSFAYDAFGQLKEMSDSSGASITYDRDAEGNISEFAVYTASGALVRRIKQSWDALKRLSSISGYIRTHDEYEYDNNGNVVSHADGLNHLTTYAHDELDRLTQASDAINAVTVIAHDDELNNRSITDANNNTTTYEFDGFGCLRTQVSPDTGTTTFTCDLAGNLASRTDARGVTTTYMRDGLGRLVETLYSSTAAEDAVFNYDDTSNGNFGKGRLTSASNDGATIARTYDARGNLTEEKRTLTNHAGATRLFVTGYTYDNANRLASITYPSGRTVTYVRNAAGQETAVNSSALVTGSQAVASNIIWAPFGDLESLTYGNGLIEMRGYNSEGDLVNLDVGTLISRQYSRDGAGRIVVVDNLLSSQRESFEYTDADRLRKATAVNILPPDEQGVPQYSNIYAPREYTYDGVGNRMSLQQSSQSSTYSYSANRLTEVTDFHPLTITYDAAGNPQTYGDRTFTFNAANRMQTATVPDATSGLKTYTYAYTPLGERVAKHGPTGTTFFHYDQQGHLLAESNGDGVVLREYIWLGDKPLAEVAKRNGGGSYELFYVHTDHINTALLLTDSNMVGVWSYTRDAFGGNIAGSNSVKWMLRFPGQYVDAETDLFYNYFRDYDPQTGRYIESDPIGLDGGINTYAYVGGNPVNATDPTGEFAVIGGLIGGLGSLGYQLYQNDGNWRCVNVGVVVSWAAIGSGVGGIAASAGRLGFRAELGRWGSKGTWSNRPGYRVPHLHLGNAPGLASHHLPYQVGSWARNVKSLSQRGKLGDDLYDMADFGLAGAAVAAGAVGATSANHCECQ